MAGRDINNYLYDGQMLFDGFASQTEFKAKKGQAPNDIVATSGDSGTAAFNKFDVGRIVLGVATQVYGNNDGNRFVRLSAVKDLFVNWENEQQMLAKICGLSEDAKNCRP